MLAIGGHLHFVHAPRDDAEVEATMITFEASMYCMTEMWVRLE